MATLLNSSFSTQPPSKALSSPIPFLTPSFLRHVHFRNLINPTPKPLSTSTNPHAFKHTAIHCSSSGSIITSSNPIGIFSLFQEFGLYERESEALFQKHPFLQYASPESLRLRFDSLLSVKITRFAVHHLITKRPEILTAAEIGPFLDFVRENLEGIKPGKLERLLITTEPRFLVGFDEKIGLLLDHGIPREKLVRVINDLNLKVFCQRGIEKTERTVIFLNCYSSNLVIRRPMLLNLDLNRQLIPRAGFFTELSGDKKTTEILVQKFPVILSYTVEHLQMHMEFWRSIGLRDEEIFKIILVYPSVFSISKERKLQPRIEFLKQCGLNANDIFKFLIKAPLFLSLSFEENLSKKLGFLVKLGYEHRTRELVMAIGAATRTSCENMQMVVGVFLSYGLSCEDIFAMSKKHPQVLQYNHGSLEKKMEYLIEGMGRDIGELLAFPAFLGYKLDERIKRRYEEKKVVRGKGMSLNKLLSVSTERFLNKNSREMVFELDEVKMD
ncbi:transcription termination factor MTERF8, chloroplastic [Magnolia sinica]|uniref:transcription termination factor MTERF8, chloroplastic n=1 Tax=Magnolia sinica TaxID=86752 RepID=UPI0026585D4E|nr:transcription termination factor MTERF8, chloroplastic [Magnolia sinica]